MPEHRAHAPSGALSHQTLLALLRQSPPLVEGLDNVAEQVQPQGIDVRLGAVARFVSSGQVGLSDGERRLAATQPLEPGPDGYYALEPGPYLVTFAEVVNLPTHVMALARPRSSLLRCGVALHNAVWDAGYSGRSQALLVVYNPHGFRVARGARIAQMLFFTLDQPADQAYRGRYQRENV